MATKKAKKGSKLPSWVSFKNKLFVGAIVLVGAVSVGVYTLGYSSAAVIDHLVHADRCYDRYIRVVACTDTLSRSFRIGMEIRGINNSGGYSIQYMDGAVSAEMYNAYGISKVCIGDTAMKILQNEKSLSTNNGPVQCITGSTKYQLRGTDPNVRVSGGTYSFYVASWIYVYPTSGAAAAFRMTTPATYDDWRAL